jgi:hypothetical protein
MRRLALLALLALGGCAPLRAPAVSTSSTTANEVPTPVAPQRAPGSGTPVQALDVFATAYINWTAQTLPGRMRALARISVGQARSTVLMTATQTARDYELRRGGIANSGTVQAIAELAGSRDRYAVVTLERTTATTSDAYRGLQPAWHLALAAVTRVPDGGWAVSSWQPES